MKNKIILLLVFVLLVSALFFFFGSKKNNISKNIEQKEEVKNIDLIKKDKSKNYFPHIIAFHNVTRDGKSDKYGLTLDIVEFEQALKELSENKYKTVFASEIGSYLERGENIPKDIVSLTFDDGKQNFYDNIFPLLKKYNMKGSLYIITGVRSKNYLNAEQIKEIDQTGLVEIGSHTVYHQFLSKQDDERQFKELKDSKKYLEDLLGKEISVICYPYGDHNEKTKELAKKAGYKYGLNFNNSKLHDVSDLFEIDRVGVFPKMNIVKYLEKYSI